MKAIFALIVIYVGTFFVAIQGASNSPVQAAQHEAAKTSATKSIDPQKDSDIRSLLELIGARDMIQEGANNSTEQYRQKLISLAPNDDKAQDSVNSYLAVFQKQYDADAIADQLVAIYDKHYTDDEIKTLLQFYGSPVGQKVAAQMPQIAREIQSASRATGAKAAKEALQALKAENPGIGQSARLGNRPRRWQQGDRGQQAQSQQAAQQPEPQQP